MFRLRADSILHNLARASALVSAGILGLIVLFLIREALPAVYDIGVFAFLHDLSWHPLENQFNLVPMIVASLLVTAGALVLAAPLGIATAVFSSYYANHTIGAGLQRLIELLAGIPSVIFGFWGLVSIVPIIAAWQAPGASLLAAALVLALMILPTIALMSHTAIKAVPESLIRAATALCLDRFAMLRHVVLPAAASGITTAVILAMGRAIGETMVVLMVAGNVVSLPDTVFAPVRTLTANIALEMSYADQHHRAALFFSGLLLMILVTALAWLGSWFAGSRLATAGRQSI